VEVLNMLKLILCITILCTGAGSGYLMARSFENRVNHLNDIYTAFKVLEAEMNYRRDPLPVLMRRLGNAEGIAGKLFVQVCEGLDNSYSYDFYGSWKCAVEKVFNESTLKETDKEILAEIGIELGKTDLFNQQGLFNRIYERLKHQIGEAIEEKRTKGKMYKALGVSFGVLTVIVLL
jgi:stage III sporulation protein AB